MTLYQDRTDFVEVISGALPQSNEGEEGGPLFFPFAFAPGYILFGDNPRQPHACFYATIADSSKNPFSRDLIPVDPHRIAIELQVILGEIIRQASSIVLKGDIERETFTTFRTDFVKTEDRSR